MMILFLSIYSIIISPIDLAFKINKLPNFYSKRIIIDFIIDFY